MNLFCTVSVSWHTFSEIRRWTVLNGLKLEALQADALVDAIDKSGSDSSLNGILDNEQGVWK